MEITRTQLAELIDALVDLGVNAAEDSVRENYSGRAMYGKTCFGVVLDDNVEIVKLGMALQSVLGSSLAADVVDHLVTDSMGLSYIVYFPGVTVEDEELDYLCAGCGETVTEDSISVIAVQGENRQLCLNCAK